MGSYSGGICSVCVYKPVRRAPVVSWKVVDVSNKEVPQRWADRMIERGFTDPRYTSDIPSLSSLAKACGIHTSTISSAIKGTDRQPSAATIVALTEALGDDVAGWLGEDHAVAWEPPAESSLLTSRQRKAVEEIIRAMTERREDVGSDVRTASTKRAGESPAPDVQVGYQTDTVGPGSANDSNVHELRRDSTPEEELDVAAHPKKGRESEGRRLRRRLDEVGEESQDPGEGL